MLFCILGTEYAECNDDFHYPLLAPPIISVLELSLCITIYFGYCALLICKFKVYGIAGIAAALLVHFFFYGQQREESSSFIGALQRSVDGH